MFQILLNADLGNGYYLDTMGRRYQTIGNFSPKIGDYVWTNGNYIYGNDSQPSNSLINDVPSGVPYAYNPYGYFDINNKEKHLVEFTDGNYNNEYLPSGYFVNDETEAFYMLAGNNAFNFYKMSTGKLYATIEIDSDYTFTDMEISNGDKEGNKDLFTLFMSRNGYGYTRPRTVTITGGSTYGTKGTYFNHDRMSVVGNAGTKTESINNVDKVGFSDVAYNKGSELGSKIWGYIGYQDGHDTLTINIAKHKIRNSIYTDSGIAQENIGDYYVNIYKGNSLFNQIDFSKKVKTFENELIEYANKINAMGDTPNYPEGIEKPNAYIISCNSSISYGKIFRDGSYELIYTLSGMARIFPPINGLDIITEISEQNITEMDANQVWIIIGDVLSGVGKYYKNTAIKHEEVVLMSLGTVYWYKEIKLTNDNELILREQKTAYYNNFWPVGYADPPQYDSPGGVFWLPYNYIFNDRYTILQQLGNQKIKLSNIFGGKFGTSGVVGKFYEYAMASIIRTRIGESYDYIDETDQSKSDGIEYNAIKTPDFYDTIGEIEYTYNVEDILELTIQDNITVKFNYKNMDNILYYYVNGEYYGKTTNISSPYSGDKFYATVNGGKLLLWAGNEVIIMDKEKGNTIITDIYPYNYRFRKINNLQTLKQFLMSIHTLEE